MLLLPRGSLKTSIGTISNSIREILNSPDIRILITSETLHQAQKFLSEIKGKIESEKFIQLFGKWKKDLGWRENEITVEQRTKVLKEPTISTAGIDVTRTGMHYDLIIVDDPHSQKNVTNSEQIEQVRNWYRLLLSMLEPEGRILVIGTRWDFQDLYSVIQNELSDDYEIMVRPAIENGKLFYPARLSAEYLEAQRKEQGEYIFSTQYLLSPIPTSLQVFKENDIKFYDEVPDGLTVFMACDPALTEDEKTKGDYTAIVVVGIDKSNNWYLLDAVNEHMSPNQINQKLFELYRNWGPLKIGIESVAFSKLLKPALEKYVWEKGFHPYIEELKSGGKSKELRIKSLQPLYEQHKVYMPKPDFINNDVWAVIYTQLLHFPRSSHDDGIDALAYVNNLCHYRMAKPELNEMQKRLQAKKKQLRNERFNEAYSLK